MGFEVSEAQEMKQLRDENARLQRLVAEQTLDRDLLQSVIQKNSLNLCERAEVQRLRVELATSERHACEAMNIPPSSCRRKPSRR